MLWLPNKVTHFISDLEKWKAYSQAYRENITRVSSAKKAWVILWVKMQPNKESGKGGHRRQNQELAGPTTLVTLERNWKKNYNDRETLDSKYIEKDINKGKGKIWSWTYQPYRQDHFCSFQFLSRVETVLLKERPNTHCLDLSCEWSERSIHKLVVRCRYVKGIAWPMGYNNWK